MGAGPKASRTWSSFLWTRGTDAYDDSNGCNTDDKMLMIKKIKIATILDNDSGDRAALMTYRSFGDSDETRRSS